MNIMRVKMKALELLMRIENEGAYTHLVLQRAAESGEISDDEYPVLVQLVRGILEQRVLLERDLDPLLPKGLHSLPQEVQLVLRMAGYQLRFLERVKKRDVVFEAVELVKRGRYRGLSKVVNAVLRKFDSTKEKESGNSGDSATINFPEWLVHRWIAQHGREQIESFCKASDSVLPVYLRVNTRMNSADELLHILKEDSVQSEIVALSPHSLRITKLPVDVRLTKLPSYNQGRFFIQDASSTIISDIVASESPRRVRDLCAAPGGKTCSVGLSIVASGGIVHASDRAVQRVSLIKSLVERINLPNIELQQFDMTKDEVGSRGSWDAVLLDAPCSGFGTVGRKVDVRWSVSESNVRELSATQSNLLRIASHYVEENGFLIYSTCSIDRAENEDVVTRFLAESDNFIQVDLREHLPPSLCTEEGYFRSWPHVHQMAGSFAAKLRRVH